MEKVLGRKKLQEKRDKCFYIQSFFINFAPI